MYCLSMATSYMFVPQYYVTCTLPFLVCWSLITRTAADNSKIKLQAVVRCPVRSTICVVAMKGWKMCLTLDWGIAVEICTHMTFCWNTPGLFPICLLYCKTYTVWHINLLHTILHYKHKTILDSKFPVFLIFSNESALTAQ